MSELSKLESILGFKFKNKDYLKQALVHRSYLNEHLDFPLGHNERLEYLGDAVLELIVTEYLYQNFPEKDEGVLTNWRASLVNSKMLFQVAKTLEIEEFLRLSKGEAKDKSSKSRRYILADSVEAVIGAIYLDKGIKPAKKFIEKNIIAHLDDIISKGLYLDPKSRFQELSQEKEGITPRYGVLEESGPDHDKIFVVGLYLNNELVAKGKGSSKHEAQVKAAQEGLLKKGWQ
ncbi:MAG: ribonuclease III [Candidatus Pacebacteria bacterium]|nr:ribonuclease III [Candidatus Paceibacterota bacterium]